MNPVREKTEYLLLKGLIVCLKPIPSKMVISIFRLFGALFFLTGFRRRNLTLANLELAFPEKSRKERIGIAWRSFLNMAEFASDSFLILAGKLTPEEITAMVDGTQLEKYQALRSTSVTGAIHITGHLGNWELLAQYAALKGLKSCIVVRERDNRLIDEKIVMPLRTRYGNRIFYKKNAMLNTVKSLKRGEAVAFLIDQKINRKEGVPVPFFGREVLAVASCAEIYIRFNPLAVPVFLIKTAPRQYKLLIGDAIEWKDDGSPHEKQVQKLTQRYQRIIEEMIRKYPDQWFWMHNRWRLKV